jgi:hypothetical protein
MVATIAKSTAATANTASALIQLDQGSQPIPIAFKRDAWVTEPKELNARIDRQSGTFLVSGNLENTIESVMNLPLYENATVLKIRVPAFLYEGVYVALRKMSINAKSIYGDLGGLAKSIRMELQAHTQ